MMSTAGRSLLAGSLLEEEVSQEELLVIFLPQPISEFLICILSTVADETTLICALIYLSAAE